jgi:hypothetical protein
MFIYVVCKVSVNIRFGIVTEENLNNVCNRQVSQPQFTNVHIMCPTGSIVFTKRDVVHKVSPGSKQRTLTRLLSPAQHNHRTDFHKSDMAVIMGHTHAMFN